MVVVFKPHTFYILIVGGQPLKTITLQCYGSRYSEYKTLDDLPGFPIDIWTDGGVDRLH